MLSLQKIAFLACRIISVYLLANWLGVFGSSLVSLFYLPPNTPGILNGVAGMAFPVVIGVLLWIFSAKLAGFMVNSECQEQEMTVRFDVDTIQVLAITIIGVFILADALPSLISALTVYAVLPEASMGQIWLEALRRLVDAVIRFILGFWLILGSKGLVAFIKKVRTVGVK